MLLTKPSSIVSALDIGTKMPTLILEDNKGCRDMIKADRVTTNSKHTGVPFQYMYNLHCRGILLRLQCSTKLMFAYTLTKQETGPKHEQGRN